MGILNIETAARAGARMVIGLASVSGEGKTFTALQLAYGITSGDGSKIGFLDSENKRGRLYASLSTYELVQKSLGLSKPATPFLIADMYAPFTPQRYKQAIEEFQAAGVEVLVLDSVSHEYEGEGGYLEIRLPLPGKFGNRDNLAATEHQKFMRAMLQSSMHIVACVRAREKTKIEKGVNPETGKQGTIYVPQGLQPIQHRDFMFEMTASLMLHDQGKRQDLLKVPNELLPILGRGKGHITAADGKALRQWVDGAVQIDPAIEKARGDMLLCTENGIEAFKAAWLALTPAMRKALGEGFKDQCKASAEAFDQRAAEYGEPEPDEALDALNNAAATVVTETKPAIVDMPVIHGDPLNAVVDDDDMF